MIKKAIRFIRVRGRIIPISGGISKNKIPRNKISKPIKRVMNIRMSDKFTQKGLVNMIQKDIKASGAISHTRANKLFIAQNLHVMKKKRGRSKFLSSVDGLKKFLRENRK